MIRSAEWGLKLNLFGVAIVSIVSLIPWCFADGGAVADDDVGLFSRLGNYPRISGAIPFQINNNYTFDSDGSANFIALSTDTEPAITVDFIEPDPESLTLNILFVIQGVGDPAPGKNQYFVDTGLFIQDLNIVYSDGRWEVMGGKFTPNFGRAWALAPDLFGQDLAMDYEFDEQIGFGGSYVFGDGSAGFHAISGSAFFQDISVLSESLGTNRGRTRLSDGVPGNTGDPQSFVVAYDGQAVPGLPGIFNYQIGFIRLAPGQGDTSAQYGFDISADLSIPLYDTIEGTLSQHYSEIDTLLEFVYFDGAEGVSGQHQYYVTAAADLVVGEWDFGTAYTWRHTAPPGMTAIDDHIFSIQAGYTFRNSLQVEVGWNISDIDGVMSQTVGTQIVYEYDF